MITNFTEFNDFVKNLKTKPNCGDNGTRDHYSNLPCCAVLDNVNKEDIDKPFFREEKGWKQFWEICKKEYPLHSVCGGNSFNSPNMIESYEYNNTNGRILNIIKDLFGEKYLKKILKGNVLEIGYGYGGMGKYLMDNYESDYYGIDFVLSNKNDKTFTFKNKKRFLEIEKSGIPENLKTNKYNFIFSTNVFQHLTQKQRFDYFSEIYDCLDDNGTFYFDVFEGKTNVKLPENFCTHFFLVQTKVDTESEIMEKLKQIGFKNIKKNIKGTLNNRTEWVSYVCKKT